MKTTYLKLSVLLPNKRETVILKNPVRKEALGSVVMVGTQVNEDGDSILYNGDRYCIIECSLILKETPMVMNNHYATLEEA